MELAQATNQVLIRLYEWSLRDFKRELDERGPLLSLIKDHNRTIGGLLLWLPGLSAEERQKLVSASVKLGHHAAIQIAGDTITNDERVTRSKLYPYKAAFYAHFIPPLVTADKADPNFQELDPRACTRELRDILPVEFGKQRARRNGVVCTKWIGDWQLATEFGIRSSWSYKYLTYVHRLRRRDGPPVLGHHSKPRPFSLLFLYGLFANTEVSLPSAADGSPMSDAMIKFAAHFLRDSERIVDGLGIND
jgi:hypothetical protein